MAASREGRLLALERSCDEGARLLEDREELLARGEGHVGPELEAPDLEALPSRDEEPRHGRPALGREGRPELGDRGAALAAREEVVEALLDLLRRELRERLARELRQDERVGRPERPLGERGRDLERRVGEREVVCTMRSPFFKTVAISATT